MSIQTVKFVLIVTEFRFDIKFYSIQLTNNYDKSGYS